MQRRDSPVLPDVREVLLSPRERAVLILVRDNKLNKEIAHLLGIALGTVAAVLARFYAALPVTNRGELVTWAHQHVEALDGGEWVEESLHKTDCLCERCHNRRVAERSDGGVPPDKAAAVPPDTLPTAA